jgi:hypothetical protein
MLIPDETQEQVAERNRTLSYPPSLVKANFFSRETQAIGEFVVGPTRSFTSIPIHNLQWVDPADTDFSELDCAWHELLAMTWAENLKAENVNISSHLSRNPPLQFRGSSEQLVIYTSWT